MPSLLTPFLHLIGVRHHNIICADFRVSLKSPRKAGGWGGGGGGGGLGLILFL